jgi:hypothetical protein
VSQDGSAATAAYLLVNFARYELVVTAMCTAATTTPTSSTTTTTTTTAAAAAAAETCEYVVALKDIFQIGTLMQGSCATDSPLMCSFAGTATVPIVAAGQCTASRPADG